MAFVLLENLRCRAPGEEGVRENLEVFFESYGFMFFLST